MCASKTQAQIADDLQLGIDECRSMCFMLVEYMNGVTITAVPVFKERVQSCMAVMAARLEGLSERCLDIEDHAAADDGSNE